jgi:hypothetical protein
MGRDTHAHTLFENRGVGRHAHSCECV